MYFVDSSKESSLVLYTIIVYQAYTVNKPYHKLIALIIDLHGSDVVMGLLPVNYFPLLHIPNPNHFVEAPRDNVVL